MRWLAEWNVGDYGSCGYTPLIFQVIGNGGVLLGNKSDGPLVMLKVGSNAGSVDGRQFSFGQKFIQVTGTTTYETAIGGTKTVLAAELFDLDSLKKKK